MRRVAPASPLTDLSEKEWQTQVVGLAKLMGRKRIYHTYNSQRSHSGFPDLVLVRERVIFVELKREKGKPTDAQVEWLRALRNANAEVYIVRPRHLESIAAVLQARMTPLQASALILQEPIRPLIEELDRELGKKAA